MSKIKSIGHIGIYVTEVCPLKCKDCNAGIPYIKKPRHYTIEELSGWFTKVFELAYWAGHVDFIGGEPLSHPSMTEICKELYKHKNKFPEMRILTSSTIVPEDRLLELICEIKKDGCKFLFYLDNYGNKLSKYFDEIIKKLEYYHIEYRVTDYTGSNPAYGGWADYRMYNPPEDRGYDKNRLTEMFNQCFYYKSGGSLVLRNGRVYPCVFPLTHDFLGQRTAQPDEVIDLSDASTSLEEKQSAARNFKERTTPYEACAYCPGLWAGAPRVPVAIQL